MNNDFTCDNCRDAVPADAPIFDGHGNTYCSIDCLHTVLLSQPDIEPEPIPIGTWLTQGQVDSLPLESLVLVTWPGTKIPHAYTVIERFQGVTIVNHGYCLGDVGLEPDQQKVTLARWGSE